MRHELPTCTASLQALNGQVNVAATAAATNNDSASIIAIIGSPLCRGLWIFCCVEASLHRQQYECVVHLC
jgi:hypothetical protein